MSASTPSFYDVLGAPFAQRLRMIGSRPVVPLTHPWMPKPGPDFLRTVAQLLAAPRHAEDPRSEMVPPRIDPGNIARESDVGVGLEQLYRSALYRRGWALNVMFKSRSVSATFLPGGRWDFPSYMVPRELYDPAIDKYFGDLDPAEGDTAWDYVSRVRGPEKRARIMLIGKHPGVEELERGQNFVGVSSADLHRVLDDLAVLAADRRSWYVTNVVKHNRLDPTSGNLQQSWINNCLPLLRQEVLLVRPDFILCVGTEAIKTLLGKEYTVSNMAGRVLELRLKVPPPWAQVQADFEDLSAYVDHTVLVMGTVHPAYVFRKPEAYTDLRAGVSQFLGLTRGQRPPDAEADIRHMGYYVERPLAAQVDDVIEANQGRDYELKGDLPIAWDAEWHGRHWDDQGAYLRTLQFSAGPKHAVCIVLREQGGRPLLGPRVDRQVAAQVERLIRGEHSDPKRGFAPIRTRHGGHWFKADIPWIRRFLGVDFEPHYRPPTVGRPRFDVLAYRRAYQEELARAGGDEKKMRKPDKAHPDYNGYMEPWDLTRYEGGWDTGYMTRAAFEALDSYGLEALAMRWTPCPRWDLGLEEAKKALCKQLGIKPRDLFGYGDIPDGQILGYSTYDADVTHRLLRLFNDERSQGDWKGGFLDCDVHEKSSREAFWRFQLAAPTFMEMEIHGVPVDVERGKELIATFELAKERMTQALRAEIGWPSFNPNSGPQTRAWLFGNEYNGTVDKKTGGPKLLLPPGVQSLGKKPIKTTGKPAKAWDQIKPHERKLFTAAVDKEVLGIYAWEDHRIKLLRDIKYVRQVLQTVLRPARQGESLGVGGDGAALQDDLEEFDGGFLSYVNHRDGRVRSRFYPVETGRCSSAGPNLTNLAKQREDDYRRILGFWNAKEGRDEGDYLDILGGRRYDHPIRSIVTAGEWDGCPTVLLEFDIKSAEIAALAWEANDLVMIADVNRSVLKKSDPNYLDMHSATAVEAFRLNCPPTPEGLKSIGRKGARVAAKNVRFGVPYGRSAEALVRQCHEQGAKDVSVKDCQRLIDSYHERYQATSAFLAACEGRPHDPGYMVGAFGRRRRFQRVDDRSVMAEQERQAKNFPIQNLVADAVSLCMYNLAEIRRREPAFAEMFRVVLQIHDALVLEVKVPHIKTVVEDIIPCCMGRPSEEWGLGVPIMPRTLDGVPFCQLPPGDPRWRKADDFYYFDVDTEIFLKWSEPVPVEYGRSLGIAEEFLHAA